MATYTTADGRIVHSFAVRLEYNGERVQSITEVDPAAVSGEWSHIITPGLTVTVLWSPETPDRRHCDLFGALVLQWAREHITE